MNKTLALILTGILGGFMVAGAIYWVSRPPRGESITLLQPSQEATPRALNITVLGGVAQPGLYSLPPGSQVGDAIAAAGGMSQGFGEQAISLESQIEDGMVIYIVQGEGDSATADSASVIILVNINTASLAELDDLQGIGEHLAQEIIAYREANGPFTQIEDILNVPGIGEGKFNQVRALITVGEMP